jgi:hypothetical protein
MPFIGFGSFKQMSDSFWYNRSLLGKRKSAREIYKEEIKRRDGKYENQNIEDIRIRIANRLRRNRVQEIFGRVTVILILVLVISGTVWIISNIDFTWKKKGRYDNKSGLFKTIIYKQSNGLDLKTDYFIHGPKAAETFLKDGMKHQNSESYYESGQHFRSALYFNDTLITEIYFFKTGDTIKNFPTIIDKDVHRIRLIDKPRSKNIEFDFFEGKIIQGTYKEID